MELLKLLTLYYVLFFFCWSLSKQSLKVHSGMTFLSESGLSEYETSLLVAEL